MRNVTSVVLEQVIAHTLNRKEDGGLVLSQRTDPLNEDKLIKYFIDHIQKSLKDSATKVAKFEAISSELTSGICRAMLQEQYLFNWDEIPGNDTGKFIDFMKQNYNIDWIKPNEICKVNGGEKLEATSSNNSLSLILNSDKTQAGLIIDNVSKDNKFILNHENGELNVYRDRLNFVEGSRKLAEKLHSIIENDRRINPCDLIVCLYRDEAKNDNSHYLALLNIEASKVFTRKIKKDSQGFQYITYDTDTEAMPTTREKLQKCAFIQQLEPRLDYDLLVLDRQVSGDEVANFFFRIFLGAEPAFDSINLTKSLIKGLYIACNEVRPKLDPDKVEYLEQAVQVALKNERFNIDTFVSSLSIPKEYKQKVEQELFRNLPDCEIEIDKKVAEKFTNKAIFSGDGGLKITIERDKKDKVIKSVTPFPNKENPDYYCVVIHTKEWKEVLK
ncbi:nucleoid-associated protein [Methanosarcina sp. 1.H.A.2.2]|uniref:nucleoid-associated protein n=1 Tax=Methanosarcina sp. 1.H.A.2.2 TaxID=1483601 RepID=UPI000622A851|nr:nucleoid-associated protein [Methanosarcina sp. 1.H.A.2.2]KKH47837.1 hypothetical protein EO93_09985 [Methanosarcina sp. 1.H.A.2.2]